MTTNGLKFKLFGNITNRFFGQTTSIERARDLARFFLEPEIRIEGKGIREIYSANTLKNGAECANQDLNQTDDKSA